MRSDLLYGLAGILAFLVLLLAASVIHDALAGPPQLAWHEQECKRWLESGIGHPGACSFR